MNYSACQVRLDNVAGSGETSFKSSVRVGLCLLAGGLTALGILPGRAFAQANAPTVTIQPQAPTPLMQPGAPGQSGAPVTVTLQDALARAQKNSADLLLATTDARYAHEDTVQARAARLPSVNYSMQYLGTQGNGVLPSGRFVTNDGIHVYRAWGVFHQELSPNTLFGTGYHRATAAEALATARAEIARRGLVVTVTKNYYGLVVAQRKYATAQLALDQAKRFLDISQNLENSGQASHSDAIKAQIQYEQQEQAFEEAGLAMENSRLNLAVLIFPALNENFTVVSDLDSAPALPPFPEVQTMAAKENPDIRVALESQRVADFDVSAAKSAFLPTLVVDTDYGIEANAFALHSTVAAAPERGKLPNLGYFITASLNVPVWDWGALRSKLHQAQYRSEQAHAVLTQRQREVLSNLYVAYNEAAVARNAVERLHRAADLTTESLRLINLRYRAGESTALELVDAANTVTASHNAYDDALARYRVALATLQTLTGTF